jgi:hypothetical protein
VEPERSDTRDLPSLGEPKVRTDEDRPDLDVDLVARFASHVVDADEIHAISFTPRTAFAFVDGAELELRAPSPYIA